MRRQITLIIILLLGAWLRFGALTADVRFHPDEALFATFARDAAVHGAWMLPGALDKPPLSLYASALSMHFFGVTVNAKNVLDLDWRVGEIAARLPNIFAGIVTIALTYALGRTWFGIVPGLIAALLTALSPFLVSYSATAFTDLLMLALMLASLVAAARGRPAWSGVWLALAFAAKQQAVFYLPLVVIALTFPYRRGLKPPANHNGKPTKGVDFNAPRSGSDDGINPADSEAQYEGQSFAPRTPSVGFFDPADRLNGWRLLRFTVAFIFVIALLFLWDAARPEDSIFALAAVNNNPERVLIRADELLPRLQTWLEYTGMIFGSPWLMAALVGLTIIRLTPPLHAWRGGWGVRLLPLYILGYLALHWLAAFNTYDRYLLPIVPLLAVVVGGVLGTQYAIHSHSHRSPLGVQTPGYSLKANPLKGFKRLIHGPFSGLTALSAEGLNLQPASWLKFTFVMTLVITMLASQTGFPNDDRARNREIVALVAFLDAQPLGAIIYDHWLGWELGYYIGAWSDKRRVYYPDAVTLAQDALHNPDPAPRWWIAPTLAEAEFAVWLDALTQAGFNTALVYRSPAYVAYRVIPPWADHP